MKKKIDKEFEQEKMLAGLVYDIGQQRENLEGLVETYRQSAYEAARMSQDDFVRELLESVGETRSFISDLSFCELEIKTAAITSKTFAALKKLPDALKSVSAVFSKGVKVGKIGENLRSLRETLRGARQQFSEIRNAISSDSERTHRALFGDTASSINPKAKKFFDEETKALEARLACDGAAPAPVSQSSVAATSEAAARVDAITAMLDEEKRKK